MKRLITSLALAMLMVAVMVMPAMAADTDYTDITGDIGVVIDVVAPSDITFAALNIGTNNASSGTDGSVGCNSSAGYSVTVESDKAGGQMESATPNTLTNPLAVTTGSLSGVTVTTTPQTCFDETAPGTQAITLSVSQDIVYADPADTGYTLTLTYIGAAK